MAFARPSSDLLSGDWSSGAAPTLYETLDEVSPSDADAIFVYSGPSTCELSLSAVADPGSSVGHTLKVRAKKEITAAQSIRVTILEGPTTIGQWTQALTTSFVTYEFTLTSTQADAITDYSALSVRVEAL